MTAHPTTCILDDEDGYRTVITLEDPSDSYVEQGAMGVLVVSGDRPALNGELRIVLSPEALEALERRCRERGCLGATLGLMALGVALVAAAIGVGVWW